MQGGRGCEGSGEHGAGIGLLREEGCGRWGQQECYEADGGKTHREKDINSARNRGGARLHGEVCVKIRERCGNLLPAPAVESSGMAVRKQTAKGRSASAKTKRVSAGGNAAEPRFTE